jgi:serine/threonine protein kinase
MVGKTISHYKITKKLGEGGMGEVYLADDLKLERQVALKFLPQHLTADKDNVERFEREAKAAAALNHPNIVTIYEIAEEDDQTFIVMEYVDGDSLRTKIDKGVSDLDEILNITNQICEGLSEAHKADIVHRDIKPENILVDNRGRVKILDFGLAKLKGVSKLTKETSTLGTIHYMSPEQLQGKEVDNRSDIWSLGVVLYELLSGELPFNGEYEQAVIYSILNNQPEGISKLQSGVPEKWQEIINKVLAKNPIERIENMEELLTELKTIGQSSITAPMLEKSHIQHLQILDKINNLEIDEPIFVGREKELDKLTLFLEFVVKKQGHIVFITGEAGSGKTSLANKMTKHFQEIQINLVVASGKCNAHAGVGDPYLPFREILSDLTCDIQPKIDSKTITKHQLIKLLNLFPSSIQALLEAGPDLLNTFVSSESLIMRATNLTFDGTPQVSSLRKFVEQKKTVPISNSTLQQKDLFEQYTNVLKLLSREQILLLILEDLHWIDPDSVNLLFHLGREIKNNRILIVGTYRPAEVALGRQGERHSIESVVNELKGMFGDIIINLDQTENKRFIDDLIDFEPNKLSDSFRDTLLVQTGGHALFTVELLRDMKERKLLIQDENEKWIEGSAFNWADLPAKVDAVSAREWADCLLNCTGYSVWAVWRVMNSLQRLLLNYSK